MTTALIFDYLVEANTGDQVMIILTFSVVKTKLIFKSKITFSLRIVVKIRKGAKRRSNLHKIPRYIQTSQAMKI